MANSKQAINSLLTEHFRYTPLTLLDDIINTINELVYRAVTAVEEGLTTAPASSLGFAERATTEDRTVEKDPKDGSALYPESRAEIENGVHQLETLLEATVDKNFDKLEIFVLRSILSVPEELAPWVRLGHYEDLDFHSSTPTQSPQTIHNLRRKLHETRKLHSALVAERAHNDKLISSLNLMLQHVPPSAAARTALPSPSLAFLTSASDASQQSLTSQARSAVSRLPALCALLSTLRPKIDTISAPKSGPEAQERREYIEAQTRRMLEREGTNVQTGEGLLGSMVQGQGARIGMDEVIGIETVAGMLEGSGRKENAEESKWVVWS